MTLVQVDNSRARRPTTSAGGRFTQETTTARKVLTYSLVDDMELAPPSPLPRLRTVARTGNLLMLVFIIGFGVWSVLAPLKSAAIASGVVEPETSRKTIQHLEGGIVRKILVKNGDSVAAGQILIQLDDTKSRSERDSIQGQLFDAEGNRARLNAEQDGSDEIKFPQDLRAQMNISPSVTAIMVGQQHIFDARRQVMESEIAITHEKMGQVQQEIVGLNAQKTALVDRAAISKEDMDSIAALAAKGVERKNKLLVLQREKAELDGQQGEVSAQISRSYQELSESQAYLVKLRSDRLNEVTSALRDTESQIFQLTEKLQAIDDQLTRTAIRAPVDGVIMDLRIHTAGGVIGAGEPLLDLVPMDGRVVINVRVRPEDINIVHSGLEAQVHLLPYNQRRVPLLKGIVDYVSADRLVDRVSGQPYYAATIRVTDERLAKMSDVELVPGMPAQTMIQTGKSSVAFYAIRPLFESFNRAFRED
jgi:HlyD family secretion protein